MYESREELRSLQRLLDSSMKRAGQHLLEIFKPASDPNICKRIAGVRQVAWATVSSSGKPRVAPNDAVFVHGRFFLSTDPTSLRARHLARNAATRVTYFEGISFAIVVHGEGEITGRGTGIPGCQKGIR